MGVKKIFPKMTPERQAKLKAAVQKRQLNLAVVLENVHDPHNVGAVLRSCDSVGVQEIYLLISDPQIDVTDMFLSKRASSGARKWIDVLLYRDMELCIRDVRRKYDRVLGTKLDTTSKVLYDVDLNGSVAIAFGNEHEGLSDQFAQNLDGNIEIPQYGMVQSLNISVACAVVLFEALRQRRAAQQYDHEPDARREELLKRFETIQNEKIDDDFPKLISE
ncbi:MAG: RNA methyltransferase [Bacteroidia bacterium]|nr:RNA methyltransferase [Bacteroidia bacterium]